MNTSPTPKMVLPAIFVVVCLVASLSIFTGSAYAQIEQQKTTSSSQMPSLSRTFPDDIQQWKPMIEQAAQEYRLDPNLVAAVMLQESGGHAEVISSSGAVGLMQVMPRDGIAATFLCDNGPCFSNRPTIDHLLEPAFNINYGARMLSNLINKKESILEALYHYGPMDVGYYYAETVLAIYQNYK